MMLHIIIQFESVGTDVGPYRLVVLFFKNLD